MGARRGTHAAGTETARSAARKKGILANDGRLVCPPVVTDELPIRPTWRGNPLDVRQLVANRYDVPVDHLCSRRRTRAISHARRVFIYAAHEFLRVTIADAAARVGISRHAASRLLRGADMREHQARTEAREPADLVSRRAKLTPSPPSPSRDLADHDERST
jgi:hypothetical protein